MNAEITVAAYPEKHPDSPDVEADIDMLAAKVDAGANRAITQFFFDNDLYFRYVDRVRARGIEVPIVPGILPVQNVGQVQSFAQRCGASLPAWLAPYEGKNGLPSAWRPRAMLASSVKGLDRYQGNHFIYYRPETAEYLYRDYTPLAVGYKPGTLPTYERLAAKHGALAKSNTAKAVALLQAMPNSFRHPTMPPRQPGERSPGARRHRRSRARGAGPRPAASHRHRWHQ